MPRASRSRYAARRFTAAAILAAIVVVLVLVLATGGATPSLGYDVSYPQCSGSLPPNPKFAVVGADGGRASNANPCLRTEVRWALSTPGQRRPFQPRLSLYLDTGDPGPQAAAWPTGGTAPRYGRCNGKLTNACSYLYGSQQAAASYGRARAVDAAAVRTTPWWLDVELSETWAGTYALNVAALRGFVSGLRRAGATGVIGIYSTADQWRELTGLTAATTARALGTAMPLWVAGIATSVSAAEQACEREGFTGSAATLAQYFQNGFDADLRCPVASR